MSRATLALGVLAVALGVLVAPARVRAQSAADEATRSDLLRAAEEARVAGDHARALERAERAAQLRMTVSLRAFLARELLILGRAAEALGHLVLCEREGPSERPSRNRDNALEYCREELPRVREQVARVQVEVPASASGGPTAAGAASNAGVEVRIDGRALHPSFWNTPYVVAPGRHAIDATNELGDRFRTEVTVAAGATSTVRVVFTPDPARLRAMQPSPAAVPLIIAGAGVAVTGAALWIASEAIYGGLRGECVAAALGCAPDAVGPRMAAVQALDVVGPVALGVGLGAATVGVVLLVATPRRGVERRARARGASVAIAPALGGLSLGGRF